MENAMRKLNLKFNELLPVKKLYQFSHCSRGGLFHFGGIMRIIHGKWKHPLFKVWQGLRERCGVTKPQKRDRKWYFDRGITVCDEWKTDFQKFFDWAKYRWRPGLTIDRINNDGNYEPGNCRFITIAENNRNRQRSITSKDWFIFGKKYKSQIKAAADLKVHPSTISRWCSGDLQKGNKPKKDCYTKRFINENI